MGLLLLLASAGLLGLALGLVLFLGRRRRPVERVGLAASAGPEIASSGGIPGEEAEEDAERVRLMALWERFARRLR